MRIALVHAHAWPEVRRGGERYVHDLASHLDVAGHEVDVITGTDGAARTERAGRLTHRRVPNRPGRLARHLHAAPAETIGFRAAWALRRRYDLVHALTESAAVAAKATGHRTIYTNLGLPERAWLEQTPRAWRWFRAATRAADLTTAVSAAAAARAAALSGRDAVPLFAGIRSDAFPAALEARTGPPVILFASALEEWSKGLHVLLQAMPTVLDHHPGARLQLAGPGDPGRALATLGPLEGQVLPAIDRLDPERPVAELYRAATVTALPSSNEALGLVLLESLASGTPVVAGRAGGQVEIVTDDRIGRLTPPLDADRLARALLEAIDLARTPGTAARCAAHARRWDWATAVGPEHEAVYETVLAGRPVNGSGPR